MGKDFNDSRIPLPAGYELAIRLPSGGEERFAVGEVVGYGGSCIVYRAKSIRAGEPGTDVFSRSQLIKEFFPLSVEGLSREGAALAVPEAQRAEFESRRAQFQGGMSRFEACYELASAHVLPRPFIVGDANGTSYAVSDPSHGRLLLDARAGFDLHGVAELMLSLCEAVRPFHERGLLYLDFKPDNIYTCMLDGHEHAALFDFDTVIAQNDLRERKYQYSTYSDGWAAPEQKLWLPDEIGPATDIYSLGAVFFWLLTGRKPTDGDLSKITRGRFEFKKESWLCAGATDTVTAKITEILRRTLQASPANRWASVEKELRPEFALLANLVEGQNENPALYEQGETIIVNIAELKKQELETREALRENARELGAISERLGPGKTLRTAIISIALVLVVALGAGLFMHFGNGRALDTVSGAALESDFDRHLVLKLEIDLENAVHQYNMGLNNWKRLDYLRAERDIAAALEEITRQRAEATAEVAKISNSLGCLYLDMGRYEDANDCLNSAYVSFRAELGAESLESRAAQAGLAQYDYYTGNYEQALREAQEIIDKSDAEAEKAVIANVAHFQAMVQESLGNYDEALGSYRGVLLLYEDIIEDGELSRELARYTTDSGVDEYTRDYYRTALRWVVLSYNNIGGVYLAKGEYAEAEDYLQTALRLSLDNLFIGEKSLGTARIYQNLARARLMAGDGRAAVGYIEKTVAIQRGLFDYTDDYPGLAESFRVFGDICAQRGDAEGARAYYERALSQAEEKYGEYHAETAAACRALAVHYIEQADYAQAKTLLERSLAIRKGMMGAEHPDAVRLYIDLAAVYTALEESLAALDAIESAEALCAQLFEPGNPLGDRYLDAIAAARAALGEGAE